jgi:DNA-binding response OmpR family regulator
VTSISFPKHELQVTLAQLEADLRKLSSTVQNLSACLSETSVADPADPALEVAEPAGPDAGERPAPSWRLCEGGWTLISPLGQRLALTTLERKFMLALFAAPSHSLARAELSALAPSRGEAGEHPASSPRGVDVMVSRLRRKAQAMGMPLPLRSVRRWGYMFTEDAVTE